MFYCTIWHLLHWRIRLRLSTGSPPPFCSDNSCFSEFCNFTYSYLITCFTVPSDISYNGQYAYVLNDELDTEIVISQSKREDQGYPQPKVLSLQPTTMPNNLMFVMIYALSFRFIFKVSKKKSQDTWHSFTPHYSISDIILMMLRV